MKRTWPNMARIMLDIGHDVYTLQMKVVSMVRKFLLAISNRHVLGISPYWLKRCVRLCSVLSYGHYRILTTSCRTFLNNNSVPYLTRKANGNRVSDNFRCPAFVSFDTYHGEESVPGKATVALAHHADTRLAAALVDVRTGKLASLVVFTCLTPLCG